MLLVKIIEIPIEWTDEIEVRVGDVYEAQPKDGYMVLYPSYDNIPTEMVEVLEDLDEGNKMNNNDTQYRCTVCNRIGTVGRCCGDETREPLNELAFAEQQQIKMRQVNSAKKDLTH